MCRWEVRTENSAFTAKDPFHKTVYSSYVQAGQQASFTRLERLHTGNVLPNPNPKLDFFVTNTPATLRELHEYSLLFSTNRSKLDPLFSTNRSKLHLPTVSPGHDGPQSKSLKQGTLPWSFLPDARVEGTLLINYTEETSDRPGSGLRPLRRSAAEPTASACSGLIAGMAGGGGG